MRHQIHAIPFIGRPQHVQIHIEPQRRIESLHERHRPSAQASAPYAHSVRTRYGSDSTHRRTGTSGITASHSHAAVSTMRAAPHDGQKPRPVHENATTSS